MDFLSFFQGIGTLVHAPLQIAIGRVCLMILGMVLIHLGRKGILEPLLMIPMGLGMIAVNAGVLYLDQATGRTGTLFLDPMVSKPDDVMNMLQIDALQPIYNFTFANGLIACFVFVGIGSLLDVGYLMAKPFESMFLALCAELGTVITLPLAVFMGMKPGEAAAIAMVGGADGPMVLFTSLMLAKDLFVPITVVAYLYLGLTYGGYPYLIRALVPKRLRGLPVKRTVQRQFTSGQKLAFAVVACALLCLLFPVAAPLFLSLFLGVGVREAQIKPFLDFINGPLLYGSTLFLGLLLGVLCEAGTILDPRVLKLLLLGMFALLMSGIGGLMGGYAMYFFKKGEYNPVIGIAAVSCVPTTAKVAQKEVSKASPGTIIMPEALGACISGVITSAVLAAIYVSLFRVTVP